MNDTNTSVLRDHGLKKTQVRSAVLDIFNAQSKPLDAETVYSKIEKGDKATIYRTITQFEEAGILKRVDLRKTSVHYELASRKHHHHIVCTTCGYIEDFEECKTSGIIEKLLERSSFSNINDHAFELFGTCKKCS